MPFTTSPTISPEGKKIDLQTKVGFVQTLLKFVQILLLFMQILLLFVSSYGQSSKEVMGFLLFL